MGVPLSLSLLIVGVVGGEFRELGYSPYMKLLIGSGLALGSFFLILIMSPGLAAAALNIFLGRKSKFDVSFR